MSIQPDDPALQGAITFYSMSIYPKFDNMGFEKAEEAAYFCGAWVAEQPLYRETKGKNKGEFPRRTIPHFGENSIIYAVALMSAFVVWKQKNKDLPKSPLLSAASVGYWMAGTVEMED